MSSVRPKLSADTPKVITAWDVRTGETVYRTETGGWSVLVADAQVLTGEAADAALEAAKTQETLILDPYMMEVSADGDVTGREILRETIRAQGPTIHPHLSKAERSQDHA